MVVDEFDRLGVDIPIDVEHQTLNDPANAPAQAWISDLRYVKGRGILGTVTWNDAGMEKVSAGHYRYMSPVAVYDTKTRRVKSLHSVALTNKPATRHTKALLAASMQLAGSEHNAMPEDPAAPGAEQIGPNPATILGEIKAALKAAGSEIPDDADDMAILIAIRDHLAGEAAGGKDGDGAGDSKEATAAASTYAEIRKLLKTEGNDETLAAVAAAQAGAESGEQHAATLARLKTLEGEAATRTAATLVESAIGEGKLVASQKEWALERAAKDPKAFRDMVEHMVPVVAQGQTEAPLGSSQADTNREGVIVASLKEGRSEENIFRGSHTGSDRNWVNQALRDKKLSELSEEEMKNHGILVG